jgi:hypothetical protein
VLWEVQEEAGERQVPDLEKNPISRFSQPGLPGQPGKWRTGRAVRVQGRIKIKLVYLLFNLLKCI